MRYYEFLLEYDRAKERERVEKIPNFNSRLTYDPTFNLVDLEKADPTPNKNYVPRLIQWWLAGEKMEDLTSTIADSLEKFHILKQKNLLKT
jgi:hypothetical protein